LRRIHQAPFRCAHTALTVPYALFDQFNNGTFRQASELARADARQGNATAAAPSTDPPSTAPTRPQQEACHPG
jgi:hypothetical protein